jgi:hypothetical protein
VLRLIQKADTAALRHRFASWREDWSWEWTAKGFSRKVAKAAKEGYRLHTPFFASWRLGASSVLGFGR